MVVNNSGSIIAGVTGGKGAHKAAMQQAAAYQGMADAQNQNYANALPQANNPSSHFMQGLQNATNAWSSPPKTELQRWWDRLQARGDDGMEYGEWCKWMDELDAFRAGE